MARSGKIRTFILKGRTLSHVLPLDDTLPLCNLLTMDEGAFAMEPLRDGLVDQRPLRHCRLPSPSRLSLRSPLPEAGDMTSQLLLVFVFL